jgi:hypothetical protein
MIGQIRTLVNQIASNFVEQEGEK